MRSQVIFQCALALQGNIFLFRSGLTNRPLILQRTYIFLTNILTFLSSILCLIVSKKAVSIFPQTSFCTFYNIIWLSCTFSMSRTLDMYRHHTEGEVLLSSLCNSWAEKVFGSNDTFPLCHRVGKCEHSSSPFPPRGQFCFRRPLGDESWGR